MRAEVIQPGKIWKARIVSSCFLERQWSAELYHDSAIKTLNQLAFSKNDWESWEWNAREALYLNRSERSLPPVIAGWLIPQLKINFHLLHAYQKLIGGWRQWEQLPHVHSSTGQSNESRMSFLLLSALGRLEQAEVKQDSFNTQKHKAFQSISLRQHRFYQQLTALLQDLNPVVKSAIALIPPDKAGSGNFQKDLDDILWHAKELDRLVRGFDYKPSLLKRIFCPRVEVNRLLGTICQYHATYLRTIIDLHNS